MTGHWPPDKVLLPGYNKKASVRLGYVQMALGTIAFLTGCFSIISEAAGCKLGYGQWGGLVVFITGGLGIAAGKSRRRLLVKAYLVCSVIGVIICAVMGILAAVMLDKDMSYTCKVYDMFQCVEGTGGAIASDCVLLGAAWAGFISSIVSAKVASYSCHARNTERLASTVSGSTATDITQINRPVARGDEYPRAVHPGSPQTTHMYPDIIPTSLHIHTTLGSAVVPQGFLPRATSLNWIGHTLLTPGTTNPSGETTSNHPADPPPPYDVAGATDQSGEMTSPNPADPPPPYDAAGTTDPSSMTTPTDPGDLPPPYDFIMETSGALP